MRTESDFLPFVPGELPSGPWLILAPHPDDETFGMGGAIALARQQGQPVDVIVLTDGAQGGATDDLVSVREAEARRAAFLLGGANLSFWGLPDRGLKPDRILVNRLADQIRSQAYAAVFFPMPGEPHPDHRATAEIAWEALRATDFMADPWGYEISVQGLVSTLVDITPAVATKKAAIGAYVSQQSENAYLERVLGLNAARAWSLPLSVSHAEGFFHWPRESRPLVDLWAAQLLPRVTSDPQGNRTPLVSVLIRTRNRPQMLREAIRSVASQTHPLIELVLVNDGGVDVSDVVAETAIGSVTDFQYHRFAAHQGRAAAGNQALSMAGGEYLLFLDDDDWFAPGHISGLLDTLHERPEALAAYSSVRAVRYVEGEWSTSHQFGAPMDPVRLGYENYIPFHAVLFRREVLALGCSLPPLETYEDWAFWLQVGNQGPMIHVDQVTAFYRIAEGAGFALQTEGADHLERNLLPFLRWAHWHWSDAQLLGVVLRACEASHHASDAALARDQLNQVRDREEALAKRLESAVEALRAQLQESERARAEASGEMEQIMARQRALEDSLRAVLGSTSWRLTTGMRFIGTLVKRWRRQG